MDDGSGVAPPDNCCVATQLSPQRFCHECIVAAAPEILLAGWCRYCETDVQKILYDKSDKGYRQYSLQLMLELTEQIAQALEYIHSKKIAHLDLKPCVCL
jgi:hypothetical protein